MNSLSVFVCKKLAPLKQLILSGVLDLPREDGYHDGIDMAITINLDAVSSALSATCKDLLLPWKSFSYQSL